MEKETAHTLHRLIGCQVELIAMVKNLASRAKLADEFMFRLMLLTVTEQHEELSQFLMDFGPESVLMKQRNESLDKSLARFESVGEKLEATAAELLRLAEG